MHFTFNRGAWEDGSPLPDWEGDEEFDDYLSRIGFSPFKSFFGLENGNSIEIFGSLDGNSFFANVCPLSSSIYDVFLPDFPSLMMFLRDYSGAFNATASDFALQEIRSMVEKLFRAQHGHAPEISCSECDPAGWRAQLDRDAVRRERMKEA